MKTIEEKLEEKQGIKEINEIFPRYTGERKTLKDGDGNKLCKLFGHKEREIHHAFFVEETERGKEYYECWICPRCMDVEGKLVNIVKKQQK